MVIDPILCRVKGRPGSRLHLDIPGRMSIAACRDDLIEWNDDLIEWNDDLVEWNDDLIKWTDDLIE